MLFGSIVGTLLCGMQSDYFGHKKTIMSAHIVSISGILCLRFARSVPLFYAGNLLVGYTMGIFMGNIPTYTGEINQPIIRKITGLFLSLTFFLGFTLTYLVGSLLSWRDTASVITVWPCSTFILLFVCPESPTWLMNKGRKDLALSTLMGLRGDSEATKKEVTRIENNLEKQKCSKREARKPSYIKDQLSIIMKGTFIRPCIVVTTLTAIFHKWTGGPLIQFYTVDILKGFQIPIRQENLTWVPVGIGCYQLLCSLLGVKLSSIIPRRKYYIGSAVFIFIGSAIIGTTVHLKKYNFFEEFLNKNPPLRWIPLIGLSIYFAGYSTGYLAVSLALMGELLPSNARTTGSFIIMQFNNISIFLVIKFTPSLQEQLGVDGLFWLFSGFSLFSVLFAYFCMPETFGKTLESIEEHYRKICYGNELKTTNETPGNVNLAYISE